MRENLIERSIKEHQECELVNLQWVTTEMLSKVLLFLYFSLMCLCVRVLSVSNFDKRATTALLLFTPKTLSQMVQGRTHTHLRLCVNMCAVGLVMSVEVCLFFGLRKMRSVSN